MSEMLDRRTFLAATAAAGASLSLPGAAAPQRPAAPTPAEPYRDKPLERVRLGFIGVGNRGIFHVGNFLKLPKVEIRAVCDTAEDKVAKAQDLVVKAGRPRPQGYAKGDHDFQNLCARDDLDLVVISTPWEWHVPNAVAAMKAGKHAAVEVPIAVTLDECWELIETAEKTRRHCMMLENCCYGRFELMMLNLARQGLLGELIHGEGGYLHDGRAMITSDVSAALWRRAHMIRRNGNLYPTHGLGPIAQCMNVARGDQFDFLVSLSSKARGMNHYAAGHLGPRSPKALQPYANGDVNSSLIRTKAGCTIVVTHNLASPRPYSRINLLQGTRGIMSGYPDQIYIEGRGPKDEWQKAEDCYKEFDHPLWKKKMAGPEGDAAAQVGHGGMDLLVIDRLVQCLLRGEPLDQNVYEGVAWSAVSALSEWSVANNSRPIEFPDFTRGQWKTTPPLGIVES